MYILNINYMKYLLTIPDELHKEIKDKAWELKKSMNQYILDCIDSQFFVKCLDCGSINIMEKGSNITPKEPPTPSKGEWVWINKDQEMLDNGFVANSDKIHKKSPSKCEHIWVKNIRGTTGTHYCELCKETRWLTKQKKTKKQKEYGYPKSKSIR